ncbi:MAG: 4Fe-4S dicluster domain-containing protein [Planctomycetota bacterium]
MLRCNQCTDAPCITICPVTALHKRGDGIVDLDPEVCIGCKACMQACPYDALYINEDTGTAEKCHFCAHRTEIGLAPACAVVCPTEAIIPGDFDDPDSVVSRMRRDQDLSVRKPEAGTGPNVMYREVSTAGIDPGATNLSQGFIWSQPPSGMQAAAQEFEARERKAMEDRAQSRTVYDVPRKLVWGWRVTAYLFTKSFAAGIVPVAFVAALAQGTLGQESGEVAIAATLLSLAFLGITGGLLIVDLKRPERFLTLFTRPNWNSWLARGTFVILAYSILLTLWLLAGLIGPPGATFGTVLGIPTLVIGLGTAAYTGFLFAQAKGRVLWMKRGYWLQLVAQAVLAGAAALLLARAAGVVNLTTTFDLIGHMLVGALVVQVAFALIEGWLAPAGRKVEYHRTVRLISHGPFALMHWLVGIGAGAVLPAVVILMAQPHTHAAAALLALVGLWVEEEIFVKAGQSLPIS